MVYYTPQLPQSPFNLALRPYHTIRRCGSTIPYSTAVPPPPSYMFTLLFRRLCVRFTLGSPVMHCKKWIIDWCRDTVSLNLLSPTFLVASGAFCGSLSKLLCSSSTFLSKFWARYFSLRMIAGNFRTILAQSFTAQSFFKTSSVFEKPSSLFLKSCFAIVLIESVVSTTSRASSG